MPRKPIHECRADFQAEIADLPPQRIIYRPDGTMPECGRLMTRLGQSALDQLGYYTYMHGDERCAVVAWAGE